MFKKLLSWFKSEPKEESASDCVCVKADAGKIKEPAPGVAEAIKQAVNDQITDAVTQSKPKSKRRRKPAAKRQAQAGK
jgi:hypothetical protein